MAKHGRQTSTEELPASDETTVDLRPRQGKRSVPARDPALRQRPDGTTGQEGPCHPFARERLNVTCGVSQQEHPLSGHRPRLPCQPNCSLPRSGREP